MSCSICGKSTGPGTMLCRPCKAALKRARQFTVQALPGTPIAVTGPGDPFPVMAPPRPARSASAMERHRRMALAALAVALFAAAAFVGGRGLAAANAERQTLSFATIAPRPSLAPPQYAVPATDVIPAARSPQVAASARRPSPPVTASPREPAAGLPVVASTSAPVATLAQVQEVPRTTSATTAAAPARDRWQAMSDDLARCAEEGGGFICDQRVRLNACDGYWGRVAQCPALSLPANPR